jgi:hypothetical protein
MAKYLNLIVFVMSLAKLSNVKYIFHIQSVCEILKKEACSFRQASLSC